MSTKSVPSKYFDFLSNDGNTKLSDVIGRGNGNGNCGSSIFDRCFTSSVGKTFKLFSFSSETPRN